MRIVIRWQIEVISEPCIIAPIFTSNCAALNLYVATIIHIIAKQTTGNSIAAKRLCIFWHYSEINVAACIILMYLARYSYEFAHRITSLRTGYDGGGNFRIGHRYNIKKQECYYYRAICNHYLLSLIWLKN